MATTRVKESRQKKLTTATPPPTPLDGRRQTTRPSPASSTRSSRSTTPTSPRRGRSLTSPSTGTKPLPNYLKPTECSRGPSAARLTDSSNKLLKKHTSSSATTSVAINRRRSLDRASATSALPPSQVHSKLSTSGPTPRERLATRATSFAASRPALASPKVLSKAPKTTAAAAAASNKSHLSSGSGKNTVKKTTPTIKKEILEIESGNALEKVSSVAGSTGDEQKPSVEAIEELKDIEQNKVGDNKEEIVQDLEYPEHPENEDVIETEIENIKEDTLEPEAFVSPVEESHNAVQTKRIEETIEEDKILDPDNNSNNDAKHEDSGEEMDEMEGENKSGSPPVKSSPGERALKVEDNCLEDVDGNLDHAVREEEENPVPEVHEEDAKNEVDTCSDEEEVVMVEEGIPTEKPAPMREPPKASTEVSKGTGKKDSTAYNDVIEETASKLLEKRKNKVKALVGAFETVISLDSN